MMHGHCLRVWGVCDDGYSSAFKQLVEAFHHGMHLEGQRSSRTAQAHCSLCTAERQHQAPAGSGRSVLLGGQAC